MTESNQEVGRESGAPLEVELTVNGSKRKATTEPRTLLVNFLREDLGLTGTHIGCDTGHCGACTVLLDGKSVKSCMVLAVQADGSQVVTVEGLAREGRLHPIQEAYSRDHGLQCGFCTPGLLISTLFLLQRNPNPTDEEIRRAIEGNLCRCTGYVDIVRSIRDAATLMRASQTGRSGEREVP